jgi:hypothetical protein
MAPRKIRPFIARTAISTDGEDPTDVGAKWLKPHAYFRRLGGNVGRICLCLERQRRSDLLLLLRTSADLAATSVGSAGAFLRKAP